MYEKTTLPNGVRILTEAISGVRTAALGIFVGTGSRHERAAENGAAHFIEHMTFKGTARRTAAQLAQEMDAIGGQVNAYTTKESTCFYARCLDCHLDRAAERHHIAVELPDDLLMAEMDARLIVQVLINLLNNAIKYTPEGSRITLSARAEGGMVRVSVADDGPGIREDARPRLFEMFYTEGKAGGDSRRGLGLGLALCRSIVNAHGGTIGVADNPPHGSCFHFTLPVSEVISHA